MQKIRVELAERSYNIVIDGGSLHGIGKRLKLNLIYTIGILKYREFVV